jgi:hypothetical protein
MSTISGVQCNLQLDPRISASHNGSYTITKGPSKSLFVNYPSQAFSDQQLQHQIFPPSPGSFLDRKVLIEMSVDFTLRAANPASFVFPPGSVPEELGVVGLRYMPLHNIATACNITVNGNTLSYPSYQLLAALHQYNTPTDPLEQLHWSAMPSCKNVGVTYDSTFGTPRSQFAAPFSNVYQDSNAATCEYTLISNVAGVAVLRIKWVEPVLFPPFIHGVLEREGLLGLTSPLIITYTLPGLARFLGYDNVNGTVLSGITAAWSNAPKMRIQWMTSDISGMLSDTNSQQAYKYPYVNPLVFTNTPVLIPSGDSAQLSSSNIQLSGIPQCAFIFVRQQNSDLTPFDCDSFAAIEAINIQFDNLTGILANASTYDLYKICVRNGLKQRYADWASIRGDGVGSVLKVEFDRDIPLPSPSLAVGRSGTFQMQLTVTVRNDRPTDVNYVLYIVTMYEGILTVTSGTSMTNINLVTAQDVLQLSAESNSDNLEVAQAEASYSMIEGGSIISSAKNFIQRGQKFYNAHQNTIDNVLSVGKQLGLKAIELLPVLLGAGLSYDQASMALEGAGFSGGGFSGGRLITDPNTLLKGKMQVPITKRYR